MHSPAFFIWMNLSKQQAAPNVAKNKKRYAVGVGRGKPARMAE